MLLRALLWVGLDGDGVDDDNNNNNGETGNIVGPIQRVYDASMLLLNALGPSVNETVSK